MRSLVLSFFILIFHNTTLAETLIQPIETYGELPKVRSVQLSPDGSKVAYLYNNDGKEALVVKDLKTGKAKGIDTSKINTSYIQFLNENFVSLIVKQTTAFSCLRE